MVGATDENEPFSSASATEVHKFSSWSVPSWSTPQQVFFKITAETWDVVGRNLLRQLGHRQRGPD
jgi:hypothetical protein